MAVLVLILSLRKFRLHHDLPGWFFNDYTRFQNSYTMTNIIYLIPALGVVGLIAMAVKSAWVTNQVAGEAKMPEGAGVIATGAMALLRAEQAWPRR